MSALPARADVIIVGGGPAGLAAATALKRFGVKDVMLLEREPKAGGIPRHCGHYAFGMREFARVYRGPEYAARLVKKALENDVDIRTDVTVHGLSSGPCVTVSHKGNSFEINAKHILLTTGVRESSRGARLIGGTRPGGVVSTGALQSMIYQYGIKPFNRPVILGTELVSFSAILTCRHAGIEPVAMIEEAPRILARYPAQFMPKFLGIKLFTSSKVLSIEGVKQVEGVRIKKSDEELFLNADGVIVSGWFRPESYLIKTGHLQTDPHTGGPVVDEFGRCSDPGFFAAGNLLRPVETAGWCWREGEKVARSIYLSLEGNLHAKQEIQVELEPSLVKYIMPQRIHMFRNSPAFEHFQLRVSQKTWGWLEFSQAGTVIARHAIFALPERRMGLKVPKLINHHPLKVRLVESG